MAKIGLYPTGGHLVKRVIGVAGDTIECCDDQGRLIGQRAAARRGRLRQARRRDVQRPDAPAPASWTVGPIPEGHIFVMGDNRSHSADSSEHMCQRRDRVRAGRRVRPGRPASSARSSCCSGRADRFRWIHRPDTFEDVPDPSLVSALPDDATCPADADRPPRRRALRLRARAAPGRADADRRRRRGRPRRLRRARWSPGAAILPAGQGRASSRAGRLQAAHREGPRALSTPRSCAARWRGRSWSSTPRSATGSACTSPTSRRCARGRPARRAPGVRPHRRVPRRRPRRARPGGVEGRPGRRLHRRRVGDRQGDPRPDHGASCTSEYPAYDFTTHKGYITAEHAAALTEHGPCPVHRMRFVNVRRAAGLEPTAGPVEAEPAVEPNVELEHASRRSHA